MERPGARRRARELALAALFRADVMGLTEADALGALGECHALLREVWGDGADEPEWLTVEARDHAARLVGGVMRDRRRLDEQLDRLAYEWTVQRMAAADRAILRIALHELTAHTDVPAAVAVNEAVELAKRYGGADSPRFINGILGRWLAEQEGPSDGSRRPPSPGMTEPDDGVEAGGH